MIVQVEKAMEEALERTGLAKSLLSMPGIGVVVAACVFGKTGNPDQSEDWRQVRRLAGPNLSDNSSGERNGMTHISKRGRPVLRNTLYLAALSLVHSNKQFRDLCSHFKTRKHNPLKPEQALIAVVNKFPRIIWSLCSERDVWDSNRASGTVRKRQMLTA